MEITVPEQPTWEDDLLTCIHEWVADRIRVQQQRATEQQAA